MSDAIRNVTIKASVDPSGMAGGAQVEQFYQALDTDLLKLFKDTIEFDTTSKANTKDKLQAMGEERAAIAALAAAKKAAADQEKAAWQEQIGIAQAKLAYLKLEQDEAAKVAADEKAIAADIRQLRAQMAAEESAANKKLLNEADAKARSEEAAYNQAALAAGVYAAAVGEVIKKSIEEAAAFETAKARLETFLGAEGGAATADKIRQEGGLVPIDVEQVNAASVRLAEFASFSEDNLHRVEQAAMATGRGIEGIAQGFGRAEESGSSALRVLRQLGIQTEDLIRAGAEVKHGKLFANPEDLESMEKFRAALEKVFDTKFGSAASNMQETWAAKTTLLSNSLKEASAELGEEFLPAAKDLVEDATAIVKVFNEIPEPAKAVGAAVLATSAAALALGSAFAGLGVAFPAAAASLAALSGPLAIVVGLFVALEMAASNAYDAQKKLEQATIASSQAMTTASQSVRDYAEAISKATNNVNDLALAESLRSGKNVGSVIGGESTEDALRQVTAMNVNPEDLPGLAKKAKADLAAAIQQAAARQMVDQKDIDTAGDLPSLTAEKQKKLADDQASDQVTIGKLRSQAELYQGLNDKLGDTVKLQDKIKEEAAGDAVAKSWGVGGAASSVEDLTASLAKAQAKMAEIKAANPQVSDFSQAGRESLAHSGNVDSRTSAQLELYGKAEKEAEAAQKKIDEINKKSVEEEKKSKAEALKNNLEYLRSKQADDEAAGHTSLERKKYWLEQELSVAGGGTEATSIKRQIVSVDTEIGKRDAEEKKKADEAAKKTLAEADRAREKTLREAMEAARTALEGTLGHLNRDITKSGKHDDIAKIEEDLGKEKSLIEQAETNKVLTHEQAVAKIEAIDDRLDAAREAHKQKEEARQEHLDQLMETLADKEESRLAKQFEKGGPGAPSEEQVAAAIQQQRATMEAAIEDKKQKEIAAGTDVATATAEAQMAEMEGLQKLQDEVDALISKKKEAAGIGMTGPMNMGQAFDYLHKDTESRWYGAGSGLSGGFSLSGGSAPSQASGPLAELSKSFQTPIHDFSEAVKLFAQTAKEHKPSDYGPAPSANFGGSPDTKVIQMGGGGGSSSTTINFNGIAGQSNPQIEGMGAAIVAAAMQMNSITGGL